MKRWCWGFWVDLFVKSISINWVWRMRKARACCALYLCNTKWPSTTLPCTQKKGKANVDDSNRFEKMLCSGSKPENWEWEKGKTLCCPKSETTLKNRDIQVHLHLLNNKPNLQRCSFQKHLPVIQCTHPPVTTAGEWLLCNYHLLSVMWL